MRVFCLAWFIVCTLAFTVLTLPRESVVRYYLSRLQDQTGLTLVWSKPGVFGLRSAHLESVTVASNGNPVLDLDTVDAVFGGSGADFTVTRQGGTIAGTWQPHRLVFNGQNFAIPDIQGDWISNVIVSPTGEFALPDDNGTGTIDLKATAGKNLGALGVTGTLEGHGDYKVQHGVLSFETGLSGEKVNGHLDLSAAPAGPTYVLGGTLDVEVNGRRVTLAISGTPAKPAFNVAKPPGTSPGGEFSHPE
ncbi:MAG TPA: hypothetical protein VGO93_00840 [Candidatus Xenobia bacterium]|jgi:hypothetical protein